MAARSISLELARVANPVVPVTVQAKEQHQKTIARLSALNQSNDASADKIHFALKSV